MLFEQNVTQRNTEISTHWLLVDDGNNSVDNVNHHDENKYVNTLTRAYKLSNKATNKFSELSSSSPDDIIMYDVNATMNSHKILGQPSVVVLMTRFKHLWWYNTKKIIFIYQYGTVEIVKFSLNHESI